MSTNCAKITGKRHSSGITITILLECRIRYIQTTLLGALLVAAECENIVSKFRSPNQPTLPLFSIRLSLTCTSVANVNSRVAWRYGFSFLVTTYWYLIYCQSHVFLPMHSCSAVGKPYTTVPLSISFVPLSAVQLGENSVPQVQAKSSSHFDPSKSECLHKRPST